MQKKKLLVCTDWFDPAYKAGGPIRSCVNLASHLSSYYDLYVLTGDRDLGEDNPMAGITPDCWVLHRSGARVWYSSAANQKKSCFRAIIAALNPDYIYLNSVYSKPFTLHVLAIHRQLNSHAKLVLAPRGMLKPSALAVKPFKKKIFFLVVNILATYRSVIFHATNATEADEVKKIFRKAQVAIADNFPAAVLDKPVWLEKQPGHLILVLVGRVHPIKNIDYVLQQLMPIQGSVHFKIIGMMEEEAYLRKCEAIASSLPKDISVHFAGETPNHLLPAALAAAHLFVLPTLGENFGHSIAEALGNGRPALISDQTPWRNLAPACAGWDCPLSSPEKFQQALQEAVNWNQDNFDQYCAGALAFAKEKQDITILIQQYQQLFS